MQLNDPFPVGALPARVRESIIMEFEGRYPTVSEVLRIPDRYWLQLPAIGPTTLKRMRSLARDLGEQALSSPLSPPPYDLAMSHLLARQHQLSAERDQLLAERDHLLRQLKMKRIALQKKTSELQRNTVKLQVRGVVTQD